MRRRVVLDASAALHIVCRQPEAARLLDVLSGTALVMVPGLFVSEVANALWKYVRHGSMAREEAVELFADARRLADVKIDDAEIAEEALIAAAAFEHPVYDMLYAVLARRHGAPVVTMDGRLAAVLEKMSLAIL